MFSMAAISVENTLGSLSFGIEHSRNDDFPINNSQIKISAKLPNNRAIDKNTLIIANTLELLAIQSTSLNDRLKYRGRAERMRNCGNKAYGAAKHCKINICPGCKRRREYAIKTNIRLIIAAIKKDFPHISAHTITLTIRDVDGKNLSSAIDRLHSSVIKLLNRSEVKAISHGVFRSTETAYKGELYRPHIHLLQLVKKSDKSKVSDTRWLELWQESTGDSLATVHIVSTKPGDLAFEASQFAGYSTKTPNYLQPTRGEINSAQLPQLVKTIADAMENRKPVVTTDLFKTYAKKLNIKRLDQFAYWAQ